MDEYEAAKKEIAKQASPQGSASDSAAPRQSARGIVNDIIRCHEKEIRALEILESAVPWGILSREDEETLWSFFIGFRR